MSVPSRKLSETLSRRIAPLAKLPVFLDLAGRRAIVIGGTAAAAWKAELLAAAGADVLVLDPRPGTGMTALAVSWAGPGSLRVETRRWSPADLPGAAIVVADADGDAEAELIARTARAGGVPVNVIDRPTFCDFQFGSIVNRSPVVVGISTDGVAPVLGQAIRRRIETVLPRSLGRWVDAARTVRAAVAVRIAEPGRRRAFWERFADMAFRSGPDEAPAAMESAMAGVEGTVSRGSVTLVGAGPGDAEYLTLRAVRALQSADVILFDDLVSEDVLELARREAKRMLVGKRAGRPSCRQEDINALMVKLARQGRRVVRLKAGDPMIFGRAGEEISELGRAGIPFDVVPGITAASAMAARLGVSLTHRDKAHGVRFITGHGRNGGLPADVDWHAVADPACTTVIYMGGRLAGEIAGRLIAEGLDPAMPVVAMSAISRAEERRWAGSLGDLAGGRLPPTDDPLLIGVGRVFQEAAARGEQDQAAGAAISPAIVA